MVLNIYNRLGAMIAALLDFYMQSRRIYEEKVPKSVRIWLHICYTKSYNNRKKRRQKTCFDSSLYKVFDSITVFKFDKCKKWSNKLTVLEGDYEWKCHFCKITCSYKINLKMSSPGSKLSHVFKYPNSI